MQGYREGGLKVLGLRISRPLQRPLAFGLRPASALYLLIIPFFIISCEKAKGKPLPVELTREHACRVCGMIVVDFPGAKAQIHYKDGQFDTFCSTLDMFLFYLQPDRPRNITAIYVNDMGRADWEHPVGNWIDAREAFYVYGGDVMGPMGEALVPFSQKADAEEYIKKHGGRLMRFDEIGPEILRPR